MKKILFLLLFHTCFLSNLLFAQQKDTLTIVIGKQPDIYSEKPTNYLATLVEALSNVTRTTSERFFLDNAGIKSEFLKCYFDTSIIKTVEDREAAILMIKRRYTQQQADFLKLYKKLFIDIVGNDAEGKPFALHDFLGKTTVIGVNTGYIGMFFDPVHDDLDSVKLAFPNVNVVMLCDAMQYEVKQKMAGKSFNFPIVPSCQEVLEANVSKHFQLSYYIVLDKNGVVKDVVFMYDSSGFYNFVDGYNFYNLETLKKAQNNFSYFPELKKILNKQ